MGDSQTAPEKHWALAASLAVVAGCVDLIAYFVLYGVFTAHMSGNTVSSAAFAEKGDGNKALMHALPLPFFAAGVMLGVLIGAITERRGMQRQYTPTLIAEGLALLAFVFLSPNVSSKSIQPVSWMYVATLAMPVLAMGLQNATVRRVSGTNVRTTYITGMLTDFVEHSMKALLREGPFKPAAIAGSVWLAYLVGAGAGGVLYLHVGTIAMLLPVLLIVVLAFVEHRMRFSR